MVRQPLVEHRPGQPAVYWSGDGFASPVYSFSQSGTDFNNSIADVSALTGLTGSNEFRIYAVNGVSPTAARSAAAAPSASAITTTARTHRVPLRGLGCSPASAALMGWVASSPHAVAANFSFVESLS